jgi:hypothetical protein
MLGGLNLATEFLNECVPLWFALLMGFTAPYMWSTYAKKAVKKAIKPHLTEK